MLSRIDVSHVYPRGTRALDGVRLEVPRGMLGLLGPNRLGDYALSFGVLALPNVVVTACLFFAVATVTRSMLYACLGVVVFLIAYLVSVSIVAAKPELRDIAALLEPFAMAAIGKETRYWTAAEQNSLTVPLTATLIEMGLLFRSPALVVLLAAGLLNAGGALWFANELYGTPTRPATFSLIELL